MLVVPFGYSTEANTFYRENGTLFYRNYFRRLENYNMIHNVTPNINFSESSKEDQCSAVYVTIFFLFIKPTPHP